MHLDRFDCNKGFDLQLLRYCNKFSLLRAVSTMEYDANAQIVRESIIRNSTIFATLNDEDRESIAILSEPSIMTKQFDDLPRNFRMSVHCLVIIAFTFWTWGLGCHGFTLGGVEFAAVTTITVAGVLIPDLVIFAAIGAYAGMDNVQNAVPILFVSILAGISGVVFENYGWLAGKGGRLGTSAFVGSVPGLLLALAAKQEVTFSFFFDSSVASYADIDVYLVFNVLLSNVAGVVVTYALRSFRPYLSPVVAANAVCVLLMGIVYSVFSIVLSDDAKYESAGCILQGAFVGMSTLEILDRPATVFGGGILSGLITLLLYPVFPQGVGGKRGTMACIAVHLLCLPSQLSSEWRSKLNLFAGAATAKKPPQPRPQQPPLPTNGKNVVFESTGSSMHGKADLELNSIQWKGASHEA